jgi:hypothetical protein
MKDEDSNSRVERLKAIYRDFFKEFLVLDKKKNQILKKYEMELEAREQERLHHKIDASNI